MSTITSSPLALSARSGPVVDDGSMQRAIGLSVSLVLVLLLMPLGHAVGMQPDEQRAGTDSGPDLALIEEAFALIEDRFVDPSAATREALTDGALRGLVESLGDDGHTIYLTPEELAAEQDALDGRLTGVGIVIDRRAGTPLIVSVLDGSPADRAGVRAGDLITVIDGARVSRLPLDELSDRVRGEPGTSVRLGIERGDEPETIELEVERGTIEIAPATWARVPGSQVGVVRIVQFSSRAGREVRLAIRSVLEAGATGIVLDLRGNPGGLVDEAISVVGAFIEEGTAYLERGRDDVVRDVAIRGGLISAEVPLVVLVDYGSASAAEILAASLRDNGRATIVGESTFGTGTVLNTFTLSDGSAIRLAVRDWLTPSGEHVFRVGVTPDEIVALPRGARVLDPGDLVSMTAAEVRASDDEPLQAAVRVLDPGY
jgi:carboxyl-terminal processing protease